MLSFNSINLSVENALIVDFATAPYLSGRRAQAIDQSNFPNVQAWVARCNEMKGIIELGLLTPGTKTLITVAT